MLNDLSERIRQCWAGHRMGACMCRHISIYLLPSYHFEHLCLLWDVTEMTILTAVFYSKKLRQPSEDLLETINYCWLTQIEWAELYKKPKRRTKLLNFWGWFPWEVSWGFGVFLSSSYGPLEKILTIECSYFILNISYSANAEHFCCFQFNHTDGRNITSFHAHCSFA